MTIYKTEAAEVTMSNDFNGTETKITPTEWLRNVHQEFVLSLHACGGTPNPVLAMQSVRAHILADRPLPSDLKDWFISGLDKHKALRATKTLDEIYGFTNKESQRNEYTKMKFDETDHLVNVMFYLRAIIGDIPVTSAARLALWREPSNRISNPESLASSFRKKDASFNPMNFTLEGQKARDIEFLESFLVKQSNASIILTSKDKKILQGAISWVGGFTADEYQNLVRQD